MNAIGALTGANSAKQAVALAQDQEAQAQSDQGRQLALLSSSQAQSDDAAAAENAPGIGRAIMGFARRTAGTMGGS